MTTLPTERKTALFWLLLAGTACVSLFRLGRLPLLDVDEPVYGEVGRLMAWSHSLPAWLTPHYNGALWFDKPPLFYWLTGLSMSAFGTSEFAARFPSALCGMGLAGATFGLARQAYPHLPNAALWAGFVLATGAQFFLLAHAAVTDMTLALTLTLALWGLYAWLSGGSPWAVVWAGAATGLACLTKGPVALVLVGGQALLYLAWTRRLAHGLTRRALWAAFAMCLLVCLPWYALMIHWHGGAFVRGFLEANNVTRFLQAEHRETNNPFYYVLIFAAFFLPWTLAVPGALSRARERSWEEWQDAGSNHPTLFLIVWCALVFVFFSLSQTKLPTYIFPLFPAMAVLVGAFIAERLAQRKGAWHRLEQVYLFFLVTLGTALVAAGDVYHVSAVTMAGWTAAVVVGATFYARAPRPALRWLAPGLTVTLILLLAWLSPTWNARALELSERAPARVAAAAVPPGEPLYALGLKHTSLVYYSRRRVLFVDSRADCIADMTAHPEHVYVLRPVVLRELQEKYGLRTFRLRYQNPKTCLISGPLTLAPASEIPL